MLLHRERFDAIVPPPVSEYEHVQAHRRRLALWVRLALVGIALGLVVVFGIALRLNPNQGDRVWLNETHTQLGLPDCTFKSLTGLPCPSCGMTTSFAWLVRGNVWNSLRANFVGTLLALVALAYIPWGFLSAAKGRLLGIGYWDVWLIRLVLGFFVLMFVRWGVVLALTTLE
ncbi:MAG: DUF2752 domain-containing protein [Planctomycetes bacterium]|nr:DUF2752 domain-containing protein [Planctomycetota bacterium]